MIQVIGLTGGIASGKSTVANMVKKLHIPVIDADVASREVVEKGEEAYKQIVEVFGKDILHNDGSINREQLGQRIFTDKAEREKLNAIVHPAVRKRMDEQKDKYIESGERVVVMDIPLLFESRRKDQFDKIVLVYVDEETQLERLVERNNLSIDQAKARIKSQMPLEEKRKMADEVINNNGTIEETKRQLKQILMKWGII